MFLFNLGCLEIMAPAAASHLNFSMSKNTRRDIFMWLRVDNRSWLCSDVLAGITLAAHLIPSVLGDASFANGVTAQLHGQS